MKKNSKLRKTLLILAVLVFIVCGCMLAYRFHMYKVQEEEARLAAEIAKAQALQDEPVAGEPNALLDDDKAKTLAEIDLNELVAINPEVLGWIYVSGTDMSFPLLQHSNNTYYLDRTWDLKSRFYGAIFLECQCSPTFSDFNTIIYGHNLYNGGMFHDMRYFKKQDYYDEHPYIYIRTNDDVRRYDIFACYEAPPKSPVFYLGITKEEHKKEVLNYAATNSLIETGINPSIDDQIISLSTCTGNGSHVKRIIVQAVLAESISVDEMIEG